MKIKKKKHVQIYHWQRLWPVLIHNIFQRLAYQRIIPKALEVAVLEIDLDKLVVSEPGW